MVKLLRFFVFNPGQVFTNKEVADRTKITMDTLRLELSIMRQMGFVKKKVCYRYSTNKRNNKRTEKKKKILGLTLNENFPYIEPLQKFLMATTPVKEKDIPKRLSIAGAIKLIIISGVFMQNWDSRLDLLIVGNNIKKTQLESAIRSIESELGRELRYAVFDTKEFNYRNSIYDKLVRDVLDFPHVIVLDKIGVEKNRMV